MKQPIGPAPALEDITGSISGPATVIWSDINKFIQETYKAAPKIMYSTCAGKPGWNVKYQKSGKSLCTLYPESDGFTALVVISLATVPEVMAREKEFTPYVVNLVTSGKPYNDTLWLMIRVTDERIAEDVKRLLAIKAEQ